MAEISLDQLDGILTDAGKSGISKQEVMDKLRSSGHTFAGHEKFHPADLSKQPSMSQGPMLPPGGNLNEAPPMSRLMLSLPKPIGDAVGNIGKVAETAIELGASPEGVDTELPKAVVGLAMTGERTPLAMKLGGIDVPLTPAEITRNPMYSAIEKTLHNVPFSSGIVKRFQDLRNAAISEYRNILIEGSGPKIAGRESVGADTKASLQSYIQEGEQARESGLVSERDKVLQGKGIPMTKASAGSKFQESVESAKMAARDEKNEVYKSVWKDLPPELSLFDPRELRAKEADILARKGGTRSTLSGGLESDLKRAIDGPQGVSWQKLHDLQSDWGKQSYALKQSNPVDSMIYKELQQSARESMKRRAQELGGKTWDKYEFATAFNKSYKDTYDNQVIRTFLKENPSEVFDTFVKNGSAENLKALRKVSTPESFNPMRRLLTEEIVGGPGSAVPSVNSISSKLAKYGDRLQEVLTPAQHLQVKNFAKTGELPQFVMSEIDKKIMNLSKSNPGPLFDSVLGGDATIAREVKRVLGSDGWKPYERAFMEKALGEMGGKMPTAGSLERTLGSNAMRPEYRNLFINDAGFKQIQEIHDIIARTGTTDKMWGNPSGTAKNLISAAMGGLFVHNPVTGTATAIAAPLLAKMYLSPVGRRILVDGLKASEVSKAATFSRFSAFALNANREIVNEERKRYGLDPVLFKK